MADLWGFVDGIFDRADEALGAWQKFDQYNQNRKDNDLNRQWVSTQIAALNDLDTSPRAGNIGYAADSWDMSSVQRYLPLVLLAVGGIFVVKAL